MLLYVAVLLYVTVCCCMLLCVTVCYSMLLYVTLCCFFSIRSSNFLSHFCGRLFYRPDSFLEWTVEYTKHINQLMYLGSRYDILNLPLFSRSLTSQPPFPPLGGCFTPVATKSSSRPNPKPHQYSPTPAPPLGIILQHPMSGPKS